MITGVGAVDAHVHLWDLDRVALSWFRPGLGLPAVAAAEALASDARAAATPVGPVGAAIAVQAADTAVEAAWLLAQRHPLLAGVVLQYDPGDASGSTPELVAGARGIRVAVPGRRADLDDVPGLDALSERVAAAGAVVEVLVRTEQLPAVATLAARHPRTRFVVCHLGLGAGEPSEEWAACLRAVAARPNVSAKASGLVRAEAHGRLGPVTTPHAVDPRLRRALGVAVDAFGSGRLLFGSDWPMSARVAPYELVVRLIADALPAFDEHATTAFWGGTARELYRL